MAESNYSFSICTDEKPSDLAVEGTARDAHGHKSEFSRQRRYWKGHATAATSPDYFPGWHTLVTSMHIEGERLRATNNIGRFVGQGPSKALLRRERLRYAASSLLVRKIIEVRNMFGSPLRPTEGPVAAPDVNTFAMGALFPPAANEFEPKDSCVLVQPDIADKVFAYAPNEDYWFFNNSGLYVHRTEAAGPPPEALAVMGPDFIPEKFVWLHPHIQANR